MQQSVRSNNAPLQRPKLIVFDLDNTLWTPELYTLRSLERQSRNPVANRDIRLFLDVPQILDRIKRDPDLSETKLGLASRTTQVRWAHSLLEQFEEFKTPEPPSSIFSFIEIYPGSKIQHFEKIRAASGIDYKDMLFFDDARDGKYGNCVPVARLGVTAAYCPHGMTMAIFENALTVMRSQSDGESWGIVVDPIDTAANIASSKTIIKPSSSHKQENNKSMSPSSEFVDATIKKWFSEKKFGFCRLKESLSLSGFTTTTDVFMHQSIIPVETRSLLKPGVEISVQIGIDKQGRLQCEQVIFPTSKPSSAISADSVNR